MLSTESRLKIFMVGACRRLRFREGKLHKAASQFPSTGLERKCHGLSMLKALKHLIKKF